MVNRTYCVSSILIIFSIIFLVGSVLLLVLGDSFIKNAVKKVYRILFVLFNYFCFVIGKECKLKKGTFLYNLWHDSPVPLYISIYVFDLGNDTEFLNGSAKPRLRQRGPFVYK
jgi:hypothetical protein